MSGDELITALGISPPPSPAIWYGASITAVAATVFVIAFAGIRISKFVH